MVHSVLVVGATGSIGVYIAEEVAKAGHKTAALVRKAISNSERTAKLERLKAAGVTIVEGSTNLDVDALAEILKSFDTIVSAIHGPDMLPGQLRLVDAAVKAGTIKRFFPSEYSGESDFNGPTAHRIIPPIKAYIQQKIDAREAIKAAGIDCTEVITHCLFNWILSKAGQLCFPAPLPPPREADIFAGGNTTIATVDEVDVGRVIARALADPRTANKRLVIKVNPITQNEMVEGWRKVGVTVATHPVSEEELDARLEAAEGYKAIELGLAKAIYVGDGPYTWQGPMKGNAVSVTELYPDMEFKKPEDYFKKYAVYA